MKLTVLSGHLTGNKQLNFWVIRKKEVIGSSKKQADVLPEIRKWVVWETEMRF